MKNQIAQISLNARAPRSRLREFRFARQTTRQEVSPFTGGFAVLLLAPRRRIVNFELGCRPRESSLSLSLSLSLEPGARGESSWPFRGISVSDQRNTPWRYLARKSSPGWWLTAFIWWPSTHTRQPTFKQYLTSPCTLSRVNVPLVRTRTAGI